MRIRSVKRLVMTVFLSLFLAGQASAVPVSRVDIGIEQVIAQVQEQFQEYLKSWVYSMSGGMSLDNLMSADSLMGGFEDVMDLDGSFQDMIGGSLSDLNDNMFDQMAQMDGTENMPDPDNEVFRRGDKAQAAENTIENLKVRVNEEVGVAGSSLGGDGSTEGEEAMKNIVETAPMSIPHTARVIAQEITAKCAHPDATVRYNDQHRYVMEVAEYVRGDIMAPIASIMAKYKTSSSEAGETSFHQDAIEKFRKEMEDNHEAAVDAVTKGHPTGKVLDSIAHLQANQISQIETQNKILLYQANMMADEIQLLGYQGIMASESYNYHMQKNLQEWVDLYGEGLAEITGRME